MNAMGHMQRKSFGRHVNFARDPLRSYFHDPQENEIHLLYLHYFRNNFHQLKANLKRKNWK